MLKKFLLTLILILAGLSAFATDNFLNSVVIDNVDGETSVVLRSDEVAKVKREIESPNKIVINLKGIKQSPDINTMYKNTTRVKGLAIQSEKNNELKIYIEAPEIAKANIVFETPNSAPITVSSAVSEGKVLWCVVSIMLLLLVMKSARNARPKAPAKPDINEIIKEREKALYKNFQKEVSTMPSMNYRLKGYSKHVLKGETIRSYESRMTSRVGSYLQNMSLRTCCAI